MKINAKSADFSDFPDVELIEALPVRHDQRQIGYVIAVPDDLYPENAGAHYVGYTYLRYRASEAFTNANDAITWVVEISERGIPE